MTGWLHRSQKRDQKYTASTYAGTILTHMQEQILIACTGNESPPLSKERKCEKYSVLEKQYMNYEKVCIVIEVYLLP